MALYSNSLTEEEKKKLAKEDLNEVRYIRGKLLDYMSTLEYLFWYFVDESLYNKHKNKLKLNKLFKNLTLFEKAEIFIKEHEYLKTKGINELKESLKKFLKCRKYWAHGFIFYEKFEIDKTDGKKKPINYIVNSDKKGLRFYPIHFKTRYFEIINFCYPHIIKWFEENGLLKKAEIKIDLKNKKIITD